jgi:site-specific DNA-methyltransferase (adenine-specific)
MTAHAPPLTTLPQIWRAAPRRWGHPLHSVCSYFAMFPPQLASVFIRWLTRPGDVVYDPFAGRGTAPFEALLHGRIGLGGDANPLAHALTRAKVRIPSAAAVNRRLRELGRTFRDAKVGTDAVPDEIRMLYAPGTLAQLVFLRDELRPSRDADAFIIAMVLGMLHANHAADGATRGFSISMPNTFAMAPRYVREYIARERLVAPELDVFAMLRGRALRYGLPDQFVRGGGSWLADATKLPPKTVRKSNPRLVFSSPPYLQVIKYGKYNWVRLWFLGQEAREVDAGLMASGSLTRYFEFMASVLTRLRTTVADDGYVCLVIGDVRRGEKHVNLAGKVWRHVAEPDGWHCHGIVADAVPAGTKVSRIWKNNPGRATKTDRILLMSPSEDVRLPQPASVDWSVTPSLVGSKS